LNFNYFNIIAVSLISNLNYYVHYFMIDYVHYSMIEYVNYFKSDNYVNYYD